MIYDSLYYFFLMFGIFLFYSVPWCVGLIRVNRRVDLLLIPILGLLNLVFILFMFANIDLLIRIRQINIIHFTVICWVVEMLLVLYRPKRLLGSLKIENIGHFFSVLLISMGIFLFMSSKYYDFNEKKYFQPGYGINHDFIKILSSVKVFNNNIERKDNSMATSANDFYVQTGYPLGGTYLNIFFSKLLSKDPYVLYQRILTFIFIVNLFVVNYFILKFFKDLGWISRIGLLVISVMLIVNYLTLNIINSSVLGSTAVTPFLLIVILVTILSFLRKTEPKTFWWLTLISLIDAVFIYSYINVAYYLVSLVTAMVIWHKSMNSKTILVILVATMIAIILPINLASTKILVKNQFTSTHSEINLFKGMAGNTIGFINPITVFSLWYDNPDYRFQAVSIRNMWIFVSVLLPLFWMGLYGRLLKDHKSTKVMFSILLPFVFFVFLSYWIIKSPYQNAKSMFLVSVIWPLIIYLILFKYLQSKKLIFRLIGIGYLFGYFLLSTKSAILASSYIGKPLVGSNYELMTIESEFCSGESRKLFVGRDELSVYLLLSCDHVRYAYDRFENNSAFWEIIALNKMSSLNQPCSENSLKLTKLDYTAYEKLLIDKCFIFENPEFFLDKSYIQYNLWSRK